MSDTTIGTHARRQLVEEVAAVLNSPLSLDVIGAIRADEGRWTENQPRTAGKDLTDRSQAEFSRQVLHWEQSRRIYVLNLTQAISRKRRAEGVAASVVVDLAEFNTARALICPLWPFCKGK